VAKLVAADDALHPRIRIISDERLSGAPREAVQTRLDLWLKTHVEKLLGPLFDLSKAEDITGIARGIAFQLIEALGVLERSKIAAEMKDLDQPSRASLRKYGVRFGAYHIYLPALLKPAARALASLLWAQKHDSIEMSALSGAQHLAGSGRTSFPVDKALDRDAYRVLGYKQCGERAVRVDILERLADLIRPALSWRESSPGSKPAGAFDGRGFVVTQAMTSLTGSAGEDFASVLRALGYRMERRAPPPPKPEPVVAPAAAEAAPAEGEAAEGALAAAPQAASEVVAEGVAQVVDGFEAEAAAADVAAVEESAAAGDTPDTSFASATLLPEIEFAKAVAADEAVRDEAKSETQSDAAAEEAAAEPAPQDQQAVQDQPATEATADTAAGGETASADANVTAAAPEAAPEPELVEVWRPGGRSEERRPRHDRNRHRPHDRAPAGANAAAAGEGGDAAKGERHRRGRRDRNQEFRKPGPDAPGEAAPVAAEGAPREDKRPPRERFQGDKGNRENDRKGKFGGGRDKGGRDSGPSHRQYATSAVPRERDRPADPNSPFAKLAALKEQLTGNRKDR
jgi:ATP-dependent RNA helicase SUPV3L1/SUV3